jgi:uncharacterized RDD family membrane protein YckC
MTQSDSPRTPVPPPTQQVPPPSTSVPPPAAPPGPPPTTAGAPPAAPVPPAPWAAPETVEGPAPGVAWAGYGERLVGYIVDGLILSVVITIITILFAPFLAVGIDISDPANPTFSAGFFTSVVLLTLITAAVGVLYFPFFWVRGGQTPGMRLFGIRVVRDADGGPLSVGAAVMRLIGYWISGFVFGLGYIWVFIDKRRRGWFDLLANTAVIKDPVAR